MGRTVARRPRVLWSRISWAIVLLIVAHGTAVVEARRRFLGKKDKDASNEVDDDDDDTWGLSDVGNQLRLMLEVVLLFAIGVFLYERCKNGRTFQDESYAL
jgi:hypothetical protein